MASFPNAKKTFSAVVNGVTKLVAALFNTPYDEIEAIETYIGATGGGAQAYSESLKGLLIGYRRGCNVEYKGVADLYVRLGEICIPDASGNIRLRRNTTDKTVTWAMIDTGAEEASTTYYLYAVADASATTFTVVISKSATTPTGATFYKLLGSFYNDASSNIDVAQIVADSNAPAKLGAWVDKSASYAAQQAATDGFVMASYALGTGGEGNAVLGYTDGNANPTTLRARSSTPDDAASITFPVRKNDYWKVTTGTATGGTVTVMWIPLN
jgi:hypothetical protein